MGTFEKGPRRGHYRPTYTGSLTRPVARASFQVVDFNYPQCKCYKSLLEAIPSIPSGVLLTDELNLARPEMD